MSYPRTYTAFRRSTGPLPSTIKKTQETLPHELDPHDVVIKNHAVSLNYHEHATLVGTNPSKTEDEGIPCSDAAAEVVATGSGVRNFKTGDHVSPITNQRPFEDTDDGISECIGFSKDGVLREYAINEDKIRYICQRTCLGKSLDSTSVRACEQLILDRKQGSILACAGVTAWSTLDGLKHVPKDSSAFMQGKFKNIDFYRSMLMKPLGTGGSLPKLYPEVRGINYKTNSEMGAEVRRLTNGRGVDFFINDTSPHTIIDDICFLCERGSTVSLVGFLHGFDADWSPARLMELMRKQAKPKGIAVGSKADLVEMNHFLEEKAVKLKLALDRIFDFKDSKEAFEYLGTGKHTGKIVIKVAE